MLITSVRAIKFQTADFSLLFSCSFSFQKCILWKQGIDICYNMKEPWTYDAKWKEFVTQKKSSTAWSFLHEMSRIGKYLEKETKLVTA